MDETLKLELKTLFERHRADVKRALDTLDANIRGLRDAFAGSARSQIPLQRMFRQHDQALIAVVSALLASHQEPQTLQAALNAAVPRFAPPASAEAEEVEAYEAAVAAMRQAQPPQP